MRRLLAVIPLLFFISLISFGIYQLAPGDPVRAHLPLEAMDDPAQVQRVREMLGLDKHWTVQYANWVGQVVQGNFGRSMVDNELVAEKLARVIPVTLQLSVTTFVITFILALLVGIVSATRRYSILDHFLTLFGFAGVSIPTFFMGILLMLLFAVKLKWLPATGRYPLAEEPTLWVMIKHMILPVIAMGINDIAGLSRYVRSSLLEVLRQDYIRTARAKGLSERVVIYRHALRNALIPIITLLGLGLPDFIGGALVIENLFAWPGMGRTTVTAVFKNDYPVIMAANVLFALMTIIGNLIADILYAMVDPRIKFS